MTPYNKFSLFLLDSSATVYRFIFFAIVVGPIRLANELH